MLIADEPTTGLDVTVQAQIFELIRDVQQETGAAMLLITHDLGVVSEVCDRVIVIYAGQVMEVAPVEALFARAAHPYTEMLMGSVLRVDRPVSLDQVAPSAAPETVFLQRGCRFAPRCPYVQPHCWQQRPPVVWLQPGHQVACYRYVEEPDGTTDPR